MHARLFQCAIAAALLIGAHGACAEQARDPVVFLRDWLWPRKAVPIPTPAPLPKEQPAELPIEVKPPDVIPEVVVPPVVVVPVPVQAPRPKPKPRPRTDDDGDDDDRPSRKPRPKPDGSGADISCADVRQALGMPCFLIRSNAHIYENYTPKQKRQAQACLTAAERKSIQDCFKTKPGARQ